MSSRASRYTGAIVGLAVGDAFGYPCEFRRRDAIVAAFPPDGPRAMVAVHDPRWPERPVILGKDHPPGTFSDDTQMSIAIAEGLLDAGRGADLETQLAKVCGRFVEWSRSDDNDRAPGNTCMTGCRNLGRGVPWREAGVADSKGAGAPMRVVPVGLWQPQDRERMLALARATSLPTHGHPAAVASSAAVALMVALALEDASPEEMTVAVADECRGESTDFDEAMERLRRFRDADPAVALSEEGIGEAWIAEEAVACALYCLRRHPDDFFGAIHTASITDGDSDTIATIVGGVAGARLGLEAIDASLRDDVERSTYLVELGERLFAAQG